MSSAPKPAAASASKKIAKKETAAAAPAPAAVAAPAAAAPAAAKKSSKKEAAAIAAPAVEAPVTTVTQDIDSLVAQLQSVRDAAIGGLKALAKLSKRVARDIKEAGRRRRRVKAAPVEGEAPAVKRSLEALGLMRVQVVPTILRARAGYQSAFETGRSVEEFDPPIEAGREVGDLWAFVETFVFGRTKSDVAQNLQNVGVEP